MKVMMKQSVVSIAAVLTLMFCVPPVYAGAFGQSPPGKDHQKLDRILEKLNLSEEQLQQIEEKRKERMEQKEEWSRKMQEAREALEKALDAPETDRAEVEKRASDLSAVVAEHIRNKAESILELKEILTPEQFAELRRQKKAVMMKQHHMGQSKWHD